VFRIGKHVGMSAERRLNPEQGEKAMKKTDIRFCKSNLLNHSESVWERLHKAQHPAISATAESCLGFCGLCVRRPFALVGDQLMEAKTPDELTENIVRRFAVNPATSAPRKAEKNQDPQETE
jgi:uncharacterized protein YuzB (UPF0349 family)